MRLRCGCFAISSLDLFASPGSSHGSLSPSLCPIHLDCIVPEEYCQNKAACADDSVLSCTCWPLHVTTADEQAACKWSRCRGIPTVHRKPYGGPMSIKDTPKKRSEYDYGTLQVAKHTKTKCSFVLLRCSWVIDRSFARVARFRRMAKDYDQPSQTLTGLRYLAYAYLMLAQPSKVLNPSQYQALRRSSGEPFR